MPHHAKVPATSTLPLLGSLLCRDIARRFTRVRLWLHPFPVVQRSFFRRISPPAENTQTCCSSTIVNQVSTSAMWFINERQCCLYSLEHFQNGSLPFVNNRDRRSVTSEKKKTSCLTCDSGVKWLRPLHANDEKRHLSKYLIQSFVGIQMMYEQDTFSHAVRFN